ncbi:hypothetical protein [Flavimaricola marinus]|uniref:Uncharacterized protein n=1 Tax=Flavimaricola marinus TaxID=1819565 RepID=A0A238LB15_9RHOB|nr:hypothetical protein [Flavimaricola marinus]SMY06869.1 hypothetical protein LOM8899_00999 [Flavimaricola marinus]
MTLQGTARCCACMLALGLGVTATPAVADQPISESMADCAGILRTMAGWVADPTNADRLLDVSDRWLEASIEQARTEGEYYPAFYAISMQDETITEWESRRVLASFSDDFSAWGAFCRDLAADHGLNIYPD